MCTGLLCSAKGRGDEQYQPFSNLTAAGRGYTRSTAPPVASLSGEWRVAGIDGESFDGSVGLALRGDADKLWWEPRCAGMARGYRITGSTIAFSSLDPPRGPGDPTPAVCAIGLPPRLDEVFRALDAAAMVKRTPSNGIEISGGGHSVTLFSQ